MRIRGLVFEHRSTALPPLPPLPIPAPAQPARRARQAKLVGQANISQHAIDEGGADDDGDGDMDDEDGAFEEDDLHHYETTDFGFEGSLIDQDGTASGSVSPRSNRPRGRKPKSSFGAGLPKDSNEYQKLRKENHVGHTHHLSCSYQTNGIMTHLLTEKRREEETRDYQRRHQASCCPCPRRRQKQIQDNQSSRGVHRCTQGC
jgi:hypothetical protein